MRFVRWSTLLWLAGCDSEVKPCSTCPPVAGSWAVAWEGSIAPSAPCDAFLVTLPDGGLELTQSQSAVEGQASGVEVRGTVYDTWELALTGSRSSDAGVEDVTWRAKFVAGIDSADAGKGPDKLIGTYSANHRPKSGAACAVSVKYNASRR